jgi:hypothetical protein
VSDISLFSCESFQLRRLLVFALQRPKATSINTSLTHELVFMRDKTSLTVPSCPSGTGAEVTGRRMTSEQRSVGLVTEAVGSIRDPFDLPLLGRGPVHRKGLRAGPNNHSDKLMGLACGEANRFIEHLDMAVFIDAPDHPDLSAAAGQWVRHTEGHGHRVPFTRACCP